jgi:hypothetical protein
MPNHLPSAPHEHLLEVIQAYSEVRGLRPAQVEPDPEYELTYEGLEEAWDRSKYVERTYRCTYRGAVVELRAEGCDFGWSVEIGYVESGELSAADKTAIVTELTRQLQARI